jgi:Leucine-rich repeat (LRR) protein
LVVLGLGFNQLGGTIPASLGVLKDLSFLDLAFNNLSGEPPASIYNLSSLGNLQLQANMLNGSIATDIGSMRSLALYRNQFMGPIPASLTNLTSLLK